MTTDCKTCDGTGKIWYSCCGDELNKGDFEGDDVSCPTCKEHCSIDDYEKCDDCDGKGYTVTLDMREDEKMEKIHYKD